MSKFRKITVMAAAAFAMGLLAAPQPAPLTAETLNCPVVGPPPPGCYWNIQNYCYLCGMIGQYTWKEGYYVSRCICDGAAVGHEGQGGYSCGECVD